MRKKKEQEEEKEDAIPTTSDLVNGILEASSQLMQDIEETIKDIESENFYIEGLFNNDT